MQRRAQEVIDRCWQMGDGNPIRSIHDVGAGGLSNALPELVHGGGVGGTFDLRKIPSEEPGMAPREDPCLRKPVPAETLVAEVRGLLAQNVAPAP